MRINVYPRYTRIADTLESKKDVNTAFDIISKSRLRNEQIEADIQECISNGRTPVILTRHKEQAKRLYENLQEEADYVFLLYGNNTDKINKEIREKIKLVPRDKSMLLIATGQKIGEGFDCPRLDTLMLAAPVSFPGRLEQDVGRLNRDYPGKKAVIVYDYIDSHMYYFNKMYAKRLRTYKKMGFDIISNSQKDKQTVNAIYSADNYTDIFEQDLAEANNSVIISSPAITAEKIERFIQILKPRQEAGVKVSVILTNPENRCYGNTDFWMRNGAYVRLKNLNIGYNLPASILRPLGLLHAQVFMNATNLFSISAMNEFMDPEQKYYDSFPLMRSFTFGLNFSF